MKKILLVLGILMLSTVVYAFQATLSNKDSKRYDYKLKCIGTSNSYIGSNTTTYLRSGCTLIIDGMGEYEIKDDMKCVIKDGKLTCK